MEMEKDPMERILQKFRMQIRLACRQLKRSSFQQEPAYVAALMGKLAGMAIHEDSSWLTTSVVNDRGPGSAESKYGADFAIILEDASGFGKAILGQAKGMSIASLSPSSKSDFDKQCRRMAKKTRHFVGLEAPVLPDTMPIVLKGNWGPPVSVQAPQPLDDYLVEVFIACRHGDTRRDFVSAVKKSDLLQLRLLKAR
ncbi:hypothetical protein CUJ89_06920 [Burkholderia pyrrocinia]|uniref:Uncharacterized protein n=2 Tax=Burkholderia pyrrocinia TaxID=60550 RepID=A0A2Z5MUW2_BURPY|nr:hypothetical protein CUJ89_06920 [Burkholderia pyrrocinia]